MSSLLRRELPIIITSAVGVVIISEFYFDISLIGSVASELKLWGVLIYGISFFLGLINVTKTHVKHVVQKTDGQWYYSLYLLVLLWGMMLLGITFSTSNETYKWIFNNMYMPCRMTLYGLTGLFISSAAYRAFKAQTKEATLMLLCGIMVMLSIVPIGGAIWPGFSTIGNWLLTVGQVGVNRGVQITIAIGLISYGLRVILGFEREAILGATDGGGE